MEVLNNVRFPISHWRLLRRRGCCPVDTEINSRCLPFVEARDCFSLARTLMESSTQTVVDVRMETVKSVFAIFLRNVGSNTQRGGVGQFYGSALDRSALAVRHHTPDRAFLRA